LSTANATETGVKPRVELGAPTVVTARMNVWALGLCPAADVERGVSRRRWMFLATSRDVDDVRPLAVCMVDDFDRVWGKRGAHVDWIEVGACERRKGLGTELLEAIAAHIGRELVVVGATREGERFVKAWNRRKGGGK
jgi:GNAT superfamily N-acetyltransferase